MTQDMETDETQALAAEYTLGLLSADEARAFEEILDVDPEFRAAYAAWAEDFAVLTDDIDPVMPPEELRDRIEADLFPEPEAAPQKNWLQRLGMLPFAAGGLIAAMAVLWVLNMAVPPTTGMEPGNDWPYVAQIASADGGLVIEAKCNPQTLVLKLNRVAGAAVDGRVLELWLVTDDAAPVSLGVLADGAETELVMPRELLVAIWGGSLAVSDEPVGGSTTGAPTGDVLAIGPVVKV